jgi:rhodanese-related sulfurtransferase
LSLVPPILAHRLITQTEAYFEVKEKRTHNRSRRTKDENQAFPNSTCSGAERILTRANAESPAIYEATLMESGQKTPEVSTNELRKTLAEKSATVFDARPFMEYAVSHIPGAVNVSAKQGVPISQYVSDVAEVRRLVGNNKAAPIVLYCNGAFCGKSKRLSEELLEAGYTNVR